VGVGRPGTDAVVAITTYYAGYHPAWWLYRFVELTCRPPKIGTSNQFYVKPHNFPGQVQRIVIKRYRLNSGFQGFTDSLRIF
jgi:hypothetical protein